MRRKAIGSGLLMCICTVFTVCLAHGYEEREVIDGGTLTGSVNLIGQVRKPKAYNVVAFPDPVYCGRVSTGSRMATALAVKSEINNVGSCFNAA